MSAAPKTYKIGCDVEHHGNEILRHFLSMPLTPLTVNGKVCVVAEWSNIPLADGTNRLEVMIVEQSEPVEEDAE